ncbi:TRAP transporter large permease subunit [Neobacillus niacini]|uniref:TRAP transporter large permease n=1 Tax=Neobacillus niacini TaxID=86668 RepID=UPI0007AB59D6|nr:TRAP transporter large permease subunit [Neobacillus niacini]MEC1524995.1 TRAP transporter large permease subunit [Neobacillus niacini]
MLIAGLIIFVVLLVIGTPVWLALGAGGAFWAIVLMGLPIESIPTQFYVSTDSWLLLAVPYFLLAGNLMTFMGPASKILKVITDLVGHFRGGLPAAAVIACALFGALSGSSIATVIAVGTLIIPQMTALGYSKENSMGIVAAAGTLGVMIPPSVIFIVYASMVQANVADLFLAGIVPGILIAIVLVITAVFVSRREHAAKKERSSFAEIKVSFLQAIPSLLMPVIVLGGIYTGVMTPTESAAIAVLYVLIISYLFNRKEFTKENLIQSVKSSMVTTAVIYIILGGAQLFATALTYTQFTQNLTEYIVNLSFSPWIIMLIILLLFFVLGTFLEPFPILFITMPILYPVVISLGFSPIHFGIVTCALMMISQITPPVGGSLFALSGYFKENITVVVKGSVPYLYALVFAALILLYVPWLSTFLLD